MNFGTLFKVFYTDVTLGTMASRIKGSRVRVVELGTSDFNDSDPLNPYPAPSRSSLQHPASFM